MSEQSRFSWLKVSIFAIGVTTALVAFAANRSVVIPYDNSGMVLFNGSSGTVTYNLECYDTAGSVDFTLAASLAAKTSTQYNAASSNNCATSASQVFSNGMIRCSGSATNDVAISLCGPGFHVCSGAEFTANIGADTVSSSWISTVGFSSSWGSTTNNGSTATVESLTTRRPFVLKTVASHSSNECYFNGTVGSSVIGCQSASTNSSFSALCCPDPGSSSTACKVEITSSGHLSSPQFNGSKPF